MKRVFIMSVDHTTDPTTKIETNPNEEGDGETRRDFLYLTAAAFGAVGAGSVAWPFVDQMNPAADTLALGLDRGGFDPRLKKVKPSP